MASTAQQPVGDSLLVPIDALKPARWLPACVWLCGVIGSLAMVALVPADVFYSCDGGLKFLQVREFLSGGDARWRLDLDLPAEPWVRKQWDDGLFPLEPPFVLPINGRQYVNYPPFFAWMSAPLHALLGYRGLYVIPTLATWCVWLTFLRACQRAGVGSDVTAVALASLIFASPLTIYAATFWEHTLGVALAFVGLAHLLAPAERNGRLRAAWAAACLGASAWLRPELLLLAVLVAPVAMLNRTARRERVVFAACMGLVIAGYFAWNRATSGAWLGFRGMQIQAMPGGRWAESMRIVREWCADLLRVFPLLLVFAGLFVAHVAQRTQRVRADFPVLAACVAWVVGLALVFPNSGGMQWGPRYLLVLFPVLTLMVARLMPTEFRVRSVANWLPGAAFISAMAWGTWINCVDGPRVLAANYAKRVQPLLRLVRQLPHTVIATDTQFVSMELTATFDSKRWFLVRRSDDLYRLADAARNAGQHRMLAIFAAGFRPPCDVLSPSGMVATRLRCTPIASRVWDVELLGP